jgi:hypothetical protein
MECVRITDPDTLLDTLISLEWDMFQAVNDGGPRASCQDDRVTFEGMRRGQFLAWPAEARASYLEDLQDAVFKGRNLVTEKYIHMMKYSSPNRYEVLAKNIPIPDSNVVRLAQEISDKLLFQAEVLFKEFPYVCGSGRPMRSEQDVSGVVSIETYQMGEMLTYSTKTLTALRDHLLRLEKEGQMLARNIMENSVRHYGFKTLEEAEAAAKARAGGA